jgi:hypothetical protein
MTHRAVSMEEHDLASYLREIATIDSQPEESRDYEQRYVLVIHCMSHAIAAGFEAGIRIDADQPEWPVVYIELPTGQVSWHMPQHTKEFDGHATGEKYLRIHRYCDGVL